MKMKSLFLFAAMLASMGHAFAANPCADTVVDETGVLNSSFSQVSDAADKLKSKDVDVRVYVASDLHGQKNLKELKEHLIDQCSQWQTRASNGQIGMKPNLFVLMVSMKPKRFEMFYGQGLNAKIAPFAKDITNNIAKAKLSTGDIGGGLVQGLNDVSNLVKLTVVQRSAPVTINQASDNSGLWKVLGSIVLLTALVIAALLGAHAYAARSRKRTSQLEAKSARAQCTNMLNNFALPYATLVSGIKSSHLEDWQKDTLLAATDSAKSRFEAATTSFAALDSAGNDPDNAELSTGEYEGMAQRYDHVAEEMQAAMFALRRTEGLLKRPSNIDSDPESNRDRPQQYSRATRETPAPAVPAPADPITATSPPAAVHEHHTTVVHERDSGDLLTGIVLGNILSDNGQHHHHGDDDNDRPTRTSHRRDPELEPSIPVSRGNDGGEADFGTVSRGGNGGEANFGEVDRGSGGGEVSFEAEPEPQVRADPEPEPEPDPQPETVESGGGGGDEEPN